MSQPTPKDREAREQARLRRLGTSNPRCCTCGETDTRCLELHHIEGQAHGETLTIVCRNCHRKGSDAQLDHPRPDEVDDTELNAFAQFLFGFADLLELAVIKIREIADALIERVSGAHPKPHGA